MGQGKRDEAENMKKLVSDQAEELKALAEEQIKMLDGLIAMLETLKTIEELKLDQDGNGIDL